MNPSRRTVAKGAAWSVPVVAIGAAAPTFAASPCTVVLPPPTSWTTRVTSGTLSTSGGGYGWSVPEGFNVFRDNNGSQATIATVSPIVSGFEVGTTYRWSMPWAWGFGDGDASRGTGFRLEVLVGTAVVYSATTRSSPTTLPGAVNPTITFRATATSAQVTIRVTLLDRGGLVANDDLRNLAMPRQIGC